MRRLTRSRSLVASFACLAVFIQAGFAQLPCDYNGDAECSQADLDLMHVNWGPSNGQFDADGSGKVDTNDILAWLVQASDPANPYASRFLDGNRTFLPGDLDLNGFVDRNDLGSVLNLFDTFGDRPLLRHQGGLNDDQFVDGTDVAIVLNDVDRNGITEPQPVGITLGGSAVPVHPAALATDPTLAGAISFDATLNSPTNVLVIEAELSVTQGSLYNAPFTFFGDSMRPHPAVVNVIPTLHADSWITLPGMTWVADSSDRIEIGKAFTVFEYSGDTGPQSDFHFGRITLVPDSPDGEVEATLRITAHTRASPLPHSTTFEYVIPGSPPTLVCDLDGNGYCDVADIDALIANGGVGADLSSWLSAASRYNSRSYAVGDLNLDGSVNSSDLGVLLNNFGDENSLLYSSGNVNGDSNVDSSDLGQLLSNFNSQASSASVVPEPTSGSLLLPFLFVVMLMAYQRRNKN